MPRYNVIIEKPALGATFTVEASDAREACAKAELENPGWSASLAKLIPEGFDAAAAAARAIADKRSSDDGLREARLAELLERAESFIAGFEGDELQEEPVDELLAEIREELAA